MNQRNQPFSNDNGMTLIELIVVVVITGILSYVAVAKFSGKHEEFQYEALVRKMTADIRYAQQLAITERTGTRVYVDQSNNRYYLKWEDGSYLTDPVSGGNLIVQLGEGNFNDVQITGTEFSSGRLDFSSSGVPMNAGTPFSNTLMLVTMNNTKRIRITPHSGLLIVENL